MTRRPIVHDSRFPIAGGSRDRRRAHDNDPSTERPKLIDHLRRSMGQQNFERACELLDAYIESWLNLGGAESETEGAAMDARLDPRPGELSKMFPDLKAPLRVEGVPSSIASRVLDHRPGELSEMFPDAKAPMRV